jgi:hypothetical protein
MVEEDSMSPSYLHEYQYQGATIAKESLCARATFASEIVASPDTVS